MQRAPRPNLPQIRRGIPGGRCRRGERKTANKRKPRTCKRGFSFVIANAQKPVIIKKYPDRRLYNTATHTFMTLDDLADLVRQGIELAIHETKSGKDITRSQTWRFIGTSIPFE